VLNEVKRIEHDRCASYFGTSYSGFDNYIFILFCLFLNTANAIDTALINVGKITRTTWQLEGVKLSLDDINKKNAQLILSATKLTLPKPFNDLSLADIHCDKLVWTQNDIDCLQGRASVKSSYWQSPSTDFTFHLTSKLSTFRLANARLGDSRLSLNAELKVRTARLSLMLNKSVRLYLKTTSTASR
jgi:hypothetical protein